MQEKIKAARSVKVAMEKPKQKLGSVIWGNNTFAFIMLRTDIHDIRFDNALAYITTTLVSILFYVAYIA